MCKESNHWRGVAFIGVNVKLYTIRNWDKIYENSRSRAVESLSWVPVPNRHDGENFSAMMLHENGAKIFSAWILILQVASKCKERGVLKKENGEPHTPQTLSTKTRAPKEWFVAALSFLEESTDWLLVEEVADKPSPARHPPVGQPSPACRPPAEEEKRREEKEQNERNDRATLRFQTQLEELQNAHKDLQMLKYDVLQNLAKSHGDAAVPALVSEIAVEARSLPDSITNPAAWIRGRAQALTSAPAGKKPVVEVYASLTDADHKAASEERFRKKMAMQNKANV